MAILTLELVNAWTDKDRLNLTSLDAGLEAQLTNQIFSTLSSYFNVTSWTTEANTPKIIQSALAMMYAGYTYLNQLVNVYDDNHYGMQLIKNGESIISGVIAGTLILVDPGSGLPLEINSSVDAISFEPVESEPVFSMDMEF